MWKNALYLFKHFEEGFVLGLLFLLGVLLCLVFCPYKLVFSYNIKTYFYSYNVKMYFFAVGFLCIIFCADILITMVFQGAEQGAILEKESQDPVNSPVSAVFL